LNRLSLAMHHRFGPPAAEMGVMNYANARIEFQRATEAVLNALRYETKEQVREALSHYWLAQKRLRVAKAASNGDLAIPKSTRDQANIEPASREGFNVP
jgi:hypothetical protein